MCIPSIRLSLPCCAHAREEQTQCSTKARISAAALGAIAVIIGVVILCKVISAGIVTGGLLTGGGSVLLLVGICVMSVKQERVRTAGENPQNVIGRNYSLDVVIGHIRELKNGGHKIGLFVGRRNDESMPRFDDGYAWFSLDRDIGPGNYTRHLKIDFNEVETMRRIHYLFDQVVVDVSVIRYFVDSPWDRLQPLLTKNQDSKLIVETDVGAFVPGDEKQFDGCNGNIVMPTSAMASYTETENNAFEAWKATVGEERVNQEYRLFVERMPREEKDDLLTLLDGQDSALRGAFMRFILKRERLMEDRQRLLEAISNYLQNLFNHVELKTARYPYRHDTYATDYWEATDPK